MKARRPAPDAMMAMYAFRHRSSTLLRGFQREDLMGKPVIAIILSWSESNPCHALNPSHGTKFEIFQIIERMVPEPIHDLRHSIDNMREYLLAGHHSRLACAAQMRRN
jgi:hypothetical protein